MLFFDGSRQHENLACVARRQHKPLLRRIHCRHRPEHFAKAADLDPQACAMRFVGKLQSECARNEYVPRNIRGPRFGQYTRESEQNRTRCK